MVGSVVRWPDISCNSYIHLIGQRVLHCRTWNVHEFRGFANISCARTVHFWAVQSVRTSSITKFVKISYTRIAYGVNLWNFHVAKISCYTVLGWASNPFTVVSNAYNVLCILCKRCTISYYYLARAVSSPEPDLGKENLLVRKIYLMDFDETLYIVYWYGLVVPPLV